jgi:hypothetical protein
MPAVSERQRKAMAIALSIKRGETPKSYSPKLAKLAKSMSEQQLRDFAKKRKKRKNKGS